MIDIGIADLILKTIVAATVKKHLKPWLQVFDIEVLDAACLWEAGEFVDLFLSYFPKIEGQLSRLSRLDGFSLDFLIPIIEAESAEHACWMKEHKEWLYRVFRELQSRG